ncbi:DUF2024 family protein [Thiolapillus sp.]
MIVDVYDTYAPTENGGRMHFDVFLPTGCEAGSDEKAAEIARFWLRSIGLNPERTILELCRYCHSETLNTAVGEHVASQGWFILPMESCPHLIPEPYSLPIN